MQRRTFLAATIATTAGAAVMSLPPDPINPAVMLHRRLRKSGAIIRSPLAEDIANTAEDAVCDDTRIFDMQRAVEELATKVIDYNPESIQFKAGKFDTEYEGGQQGITHRYKDVVVNVFEFKSLQGSMVTVLRCGVCG